MINQITQMNETICAISTPPGVGGISVCRLSGSSAIEIADRIWKGKKLANAASHTVHLGEVADSEGNPLDQAVATVFRAPASFTGDDTVEFSTHGSRYVQAEILNSLIAAGARLAEPGEFTRRAFAAGRIDLAEAESVADIIASESRAAHRLAYSQLKGALSQRMSLLRDQLVDLVSLMELELDFSEEDVEFADRSRLISIARQISDEINRLKKSFAAGNAIKNGIPVAIVGDTNAGKSSLLNRLLGDERAIVSNIHGTTRDTIEETATYGDYQFRFIDTAGLRDTSDEIESLGIKRSIAALEKAHIILVVCDITRPINKELIEMVQTNSAPEATAIIVANKTDIAPDAPFLEQAARIAPGMKTIPISAAKAEGIAELTDQLVATISAQNAPGSDTVIITNLRHLSALQLASASIARTIDGLSTGLPGDLVSQDIRETLHHLATITGTIPSSEILATIFSRFCIGK